MSRVARICFTLNNYTPDEQLTVASLVDSHPDDYAYVCFGREVGASGTPHLQGVIFFAPGKRFRFNQIKAMIGIDRLHIEAMRGTPTQAIAYCKKDGDWVDFGEEPTATQGRRTDLEAVTTWIKEFIADNDRAPSSHEIAQVYPVMLIKYRNLPMVAKLMVPKVPSNFQLGAPRGWQADLETQLDVDSTDDRKILFFVDPVGNCGKTWFTRYYLAKNPDRTQILGTGSYNDLAFLVDENCSVFFFNVPRNGMEFLPYRLLESLKDRLVQSNKYESRTKLLSKIPHVVVMCNEQPNKNALSEDRYDIVELSTPTVTAFGFTFPISRTPL